MEKEKLFCIKVSDGVTVEAAYPEILKNINGPVIHLTDASLHWLTLWERVLLYFKFTDVEKLDTKYTSVDKETCLYIYKNLKPV